jgi:hypothetical protein
MITELIKTRSELLKDVINKDGVHYGGIATVVVYDDLAHEKGEIYQYCTDWCAWRLITSLYAFSDAVGLKQAEVLAELRRARSIGDDTKYPEYFGVPATDLDQETFQSLDRRRKGDRSIVYYKSNVLAYTFAGVIDELRRLEHRDLLPYLIRLPGNDAGRLCLAIDKDNVPMVVQTRVRACNPLFLEFST